MTRINVCLAICRLKGEVEGEYVSFQLVLCRDQVEGGRLVSCCKQGILNEVDVVKCKIQHRV